MKWKTKKLESVADFCLGKMLDQKKNRGEPLPYLANVNVRWGEFDLADLREMRFEHHELERYALRYGDIVMCEGGEPGRCAIWKDQRSSMMIQKALHRIRPHEYLTPEFLYYFFLYKGRTGHLSPLFTGATIKHLPREKLALVEVPVPPRSVQEHIASILSAYDDLIENNRRRIQLLEQAARLLYKEWFVHLRFPGHEHSKIIDGLPEGWEKMPFEDALMLQRGFDLPSHERKEGSIPVYASTGVNGTHNMAKVTGPGVVTGRSGSLGMVHYVHEDFWPLNTALWIKEFKQLSPHFAYFLLSALHLEQYNGGVSVPTLDRKIVHKIPIVVPKANVQSLFDEYVLPILEQIRRLRLYNDKLNETRDLLLPKLMNGEVVV
jgi:type I restriction enzyme S subunit